MIDINKFRNAEILDENIRDYEGSNELARKLIMTYANDNAKTNAVLPSTSNQIMLDKYITGFLNSVVNTYGLVLKGEHFTTDDLITRWNNLTTFFVNQINPLYNYYVVNKFTNDIVTRVDDIKEKNKSLEEEYGDLKYGLNKNALTLLYNYVKNGVLRPIPYTLLNSVDEIDIDRQDALRDAEQRRYANTPSPPPPALAPPLAPSPPASRPASPYLGQLYGFGEGIEKKEVKGMGKKAFKDASLGETPSGYTTSQASPNRDSVKTVKAHYAGKGLPKLIRF